MKSRGHFEINWPLAKEKSVNTTMYLYSRSVITIMDNFKDGKSYDQNDSLITSPLVSGVRLGKGREWMKIGVGMNYSQIIMTPNGRDWKQANYNLSARYCTPLWVCNRFSLGFYFYSKAFFF